MTIHNKKGTTDLILEENYVISNMRDLFWEIWSSSSKV